MTDLRKAAEMALAKLDHLWEIGIDAEYKVELLPEIHALRQALAQPEQNPVAWMNIEDNIFYKYEFKSCAESDKNAVPLYTAPPKREWVGLTDEEIEECKINGGLPHAINWRLSVKVMEAKLKEKNT